MNAFLGRGMCPTGCLRAWDFFEGSGGVRVGVGSIIFEVVDFILGFLERGIRYKGGHEGCNDPPRRGSSILIFSFDPADRQGHDGPHNRKKSGGGLSNNSGRGRAGEPEQEVQGQRQKRSRTGPLCRYLI